MAINIEQLLASLQQKKQIKELSPKLVRDKIPQLYNKDGNWQYYNAEDKEFHQYLRLKLLEEIEEFLADETLDELADVLEVLEAFCSLKNWQPTEVQRAKLNKKNSRGNFSKRIIAVNGKLK